MTRAPHLCLLPIMIGLAVLGCDGKRGVLGELDSDTEGESGTGGDTESGVEETETGSPETATTGDTTTDGAEETGTSTGETDGVCGESICCPEDRDGDGIPDIGDNAIGRANPRQSDLDVDGIADVLDLCPMTPGTGADFAADSDNDGIGNACDRCARTVQTYNDFEAADGLSPGALVRNIPTNDDFDGDGIGDACDNCVAVPNCSDWGIQNRHTIGQPTHDADACQIDDNSDGIGDVCEGMTLPGAAGPVGFGDDEDFDQDGIPNLEDGCMRLPVPMDQRQTCEDSTDCGTDRDCASTGFCDHVDSDADGVGDACDTCAFTANPEQLLVGGAEIDDEDGDFVGAGCEASVACAERRNPAQIGFYRVSVDGACCVPQLVVGGDGRVIPVANCLPLLTGEGDVSDCPSLWVPDLDDPSNRLEVHDDCTGFTNCAELPAFVVNRPGVFSEPAGCSDALQQAGVDLQDNYITSLETASSPDELWGHACRLPQLDIDFDGLGDQCDKCPLAHDPDDKQYVDPDGRLWPSDGALCNGDYRCE